MRHGFLGVIWILRRRCSPGCSVTVVSTVVNPARSKCNRYVPERRVSTPRVRWPLGKPLIDTNDQVGTISICRTLGGAGPAATTVTAVGVLLTPSLVAVTV